jgi:HEAT repeat protein
MNIINRSTFQARRTRTLKRVHVLIFFLLIFIHGIISYTSQGAHHKPGMFHCLEGRDSLKNVTLEDSPEGVRQKVTVLLTYNDRKSEVTRYATALELASLGYSAIEPLLVALQDRDEVTRAIAAEALGEAGDRRAVLPLVRVLHDTSSIVRKKSAEALGLLGNRRAVPALIKVIDDREKEVSYYAEVSLGKLHDRRALTPLIKALDRKETIDGAIEALKEMKDPRAVKPLMKLLDSEGKETSSHAASALGEIGDPVCVPHLVEKIRKNRWDEGKTGRHIQRRDIYSFASALKCADQASLSHVMKLLSADTWQARYIAGKALAEIDSPIAHNALMKAFNERRLDVIAGGHLFFIKKGIPGSETVLAWALDEYSDFYMTGAFSNCGSRKMNKIASLDSMKKCYCNHCMKGVRNGTWGERHF